MQEVNGNSRKSLILLAVFTAVLCMMLSAGGSGVFMLFSGLQAERQRAAQVAATRTATVMQPQQTVTAAAARSLKETEESSRSVVARAAEWPLLLFDDFASDTGTWSTGPRNTEFYFSSRNIRDGGFHWDAMARRDFASKSVADTRPTSDFSLSVKGAQVHGETGTYGLVYRALDDVNFHEFGIVESTVVLARVRYESDWSVVFGPVMHFGIRPAGEANQLRVIANGPHFALFINDQFVGEYVDERLAVGWTGMYISLFREGDRASFEFDNFELRAP